MPPAAIYSRANHKISIGAAVTHWERYAFRYLAGTVFVLLVGGTVFYHIVERFSWVNAYYFCVVTLTTVGYGDVVPKTDFGKIFTTFYIMIGVGVITTFLSTLIRRRGLKMKERMNIDITTTNSIDVSGKDH